MKTVFRILAAVPLFIFVAGLFWITYDNVQRLYYEHFVYPKLKAIDGYVASNRWQDYAFILITISLALFSLAGARILLRNPVGSKHPTTPSA